LGVLTLGLGAQPALAADHTDGPAASMDPAADITDVYSWISADKMKTYLVLDLYKNAAATAQFTNTVQYVIHVGANTAYSPGAQPKDLHTIICTFDNAMPQVGSCWLTDKTGAAVDYVTGDLTDKAGKVSVNGHMKAYAGVRDDPFFFNIDGLKTVVGDAIAAEMAGMLTLDGTCPAGLGPEGAKLAKGTGGVAPVDNFAGLNVLSIVLAVDTASLATGSNKILSVWASTHK
jgi:hypothetical protein